MKKEKLRYYAPVVVCLLLIVFLLLLPTGYEGAVQYQEAERCIAEVTAVDNSAIVDTGLVRSGEQRCLRERQRQPSIYCKALWSKINCLQRATRHRW